MKTEKQTRIVSLTTKEMATLRSILRSHGLDLCGRLRKGCPNCYSSRGSRVMRSEPLFTGRVARIADGGTYAVEVWSRRSRRVQKRAGVIVVC